MKSVRWDITGRCNLSCKHCQASKFYKNENKRKDLSTSEALILIDKISDLGAQRVGILGGEPLLRSDLLDILEYLKSKQIKTVLNTNGLDIDKVDCRRIFECVETIVVSIDGICANDHDNLRGIGSFEKTIMNIENLIKQDRKSRVGVSLVLNQYNFKSAKDIFSFMNSLQVDFCMIDVVHSIGNAKDNWSNLALSNDEVIKSTCDLITTWDFASGVILIPRMYTNKFRDYLCKITGIRLNDKYVCDVPGKTSLYILNDGTVVPSQLFAYLSDEIDFMSKSLLTNSFEEIVSCEDYKEFMSLYERKLYLNYYEPCATCEYSGKQCNPSPVAYWLGRKTPIPYCELGC